MEPETPAAKAIAIQLSLDAADLFAEAFSGAFAEKVRIDGKPRDRVHHSVLVMSVAKGAPVGEGAG